MTVVITAETAPSTAIVEYIAASRDTFSSMAIIVLWRTVATPKLQSSGPAVKYYIGNYIVRDDAVYRGAIRVLEALNGHKATKQDRDVPCDTALMSNNIGSSSVHVFR